MFKGKAHLAAILAAAAGIGATVSTTEPAQRGASATEARAGGQHQAPQKQAPASSQAKAASRRSYDDLIASMPLSFWTAGPGYPIPRPPYGVRKAQRAARKRRNVLKNRRAHRG